MSFLVINLIMRLPSLSTTAKHLFYWLLAVYLISALIIPSVSDIVAGCLLLLGWTYVLCFFERTNLTKMEWAVILIFVLYSVNSLMSFLFVDSQRLAQYRLEDDVKFAFLLPLFMYLRNTKISEKYLIRLFVFVVIFLGITSLVQAYGMYNYREVWFVFDGYTAHMYRPAGSVNPMRYAAITLILSAFIFAYLMLFKVDKYFLRMLFLVSILFGIGACLLTQTRGVWLAVPIILLFFIFYLFRAGNKKAGGAVLLSGILVIAFLSQLDVVEKRVEKAVKSIELYEDGNSQTSIGARLDMYVVAFQLFKEKPLFGHGLNGFKVKTSEMKESGELEGYSRELGVRKTAHNEFFQAAVEKGGVGLILTMGLFLIPLYVFYLNVSSPDRVIRWFASCGVLMLVVLFVAGQSGTIMNHKTFTHFYIFMVFLFLSQIYYRKDAMLDGIKENK